MSNLKNHRKRLTASNITILVILLYLVIFEFTWVSQTFIPKPSLLLESFLSLWSVYNLNSALVETTSVIFPVLFFSVIIFEAFGGVFMSLIYKYGGILNIAAPFKYFSFFFFALIINLIFPQSFWAKVIFALLFTIFMQLKKISERKEYVKSEYIIAAKSLGTKENKIFSKVVWKNIQPLFYDELTSVHFRLWTAVLIYEFISATLGLGAVYRTAFEFKDLSGIIALGIFIALIILAVNSILKYAISKFIFWK